MSMITFKVMTVAIKSGLEKCVIGKVIIASKTTQEVVLERKMSQTSKKTIMTIHHPETYML